VIGETITERKLRKRREWYARNKEREAERYVRDYLKHRKEHLARSRKYREDSPDKVKLAKQEYTISEKGKAAKLRDEAKYKASGGRAAAEKRRESRPISGARIAARKRWAARNKWYAAADRAQRRMLAKYPVSAADKVEMDGMYLFCNIFPGFEVDHIIPVKGKNVCGLHVLKNLQVIPRSENRRKGNSFCPAVAQLCA
tara:strand:+ start:82 stop:678 length:597 start_codon:yes stop_codon:yes gene_type:complete